MYEKIQEIINDWDPIDLFPLAPKDEYSQEINKIMNTVKENPGIDWDKLAIAIRKIFLDSFGETLLFKNNEEEIAKKILELYY